MTMGYTGSFNDFDLEIYGHILHFFPFSRLLAENATKCSNGDRAGTKIWTFSPLVQFPPFLCERRKRIILNVFIKEERKEK